VIATQQIAGNDSGPFLRQPEIVVMHATRSTIATKTDAEELQSTLNWFVNPEGASSHWVLSELERVRVVQDSLIAWHSAWLNGRSWSIEMTQPTIDRDFTDGHYANAALIGQNYVKLGVTPVWLDYWDGEDGSGFVDHEDTKQGREAGKTDIGPKFDRARFISSLEDGMDEATVQKIVGKAIEANNNSKWRFKQIADNLPALNAHLRNIVNGLIKASGGGGYTDEQAVKAVKDKL
jgi:hypothetical protein